MTAAIVGNQVNLVLFLSNIQIVSEDDSNQSQQNQQLEEFEMQNERMIS